MAAPGPLAPALLLALLLLQLGASPAARSDPRKLLNMMQIMSRYFRQGTRYDEGHVPDAPAERIVRKGEYDFVIVGAGNAGSVMAARLSEIPEWSVLLLEAGVDENPMSEIPATVAALQSTSLNWGYVAEPQDEACLAMYDRQCRWPRGKALGGTSAINYMIYTRGNRLDYDMWAAAGNTGWSYDELLPYFKKSERIGIPALQDSPYHGHRGPLNVEKLPYTTPLVDAFVDAGRELGYPALDYNGADQFGFSKIQANQRNGTRCSANKAFLQPVRLRRNLDVSTRSQVTRVLIDPSSKRAYGVEFVKNRRVYTVRARKEVIVSGGALNSPQVLMLSGVGPRKHLEELGIPVIQDLPVGENLQEHVAFLGPTFLVNQSVSITEDMVVNNPKNYADYLFRGRGPFTSLGGAEGIAYMRTPLHGRDGDQRPDIEILFIGATLAADKGGPVRMGLGMRKDFYDEYFGPLNGRDGFSMWPLLMHPKSRGVLRLKSKDPFKWPRFYANFFSHPEDIQVLVEGIKLAFRIGLSPAFQRFGARPYTKPIPGCGHLPFASDAYWACAARTITGTLHHQLGTCKMGPASDPGAVVDPNLRVHGMSGLRVVDASVFPTSLTCHTNAPAYMVGEKGADLVKSTWGH